MRKCVGAMQRHPLRQYHSFPKAGTRVDAPVNEYPKLRIAQPSDTQQLPEGLPVGLKFSRTDCDIDVGQTFVEFH